MNCCPWNYFHHAKVGSMLLFSLLFFLLTISNKNTTFLGVSQTRTIEALFFSLKAFEEKPCAIFLEQHH
jgi:hypothetical protein